MARLKPIINVRELPPACAKLRQSLPSLNDLVRDAPGPHEADVLAYLRQGMVCGVYNDRGLLSDVLNPRRRIDGLPAEEGTAPLQPNLLLTDGVWVWPGALVFYLATYHLRLPDEFLAHAARAGWKVDPTAAQNHALNWEAFDAAPVLSSAAP